MMLHFLKSDMNNARVSVCENPHNALLDVLNDRRHKLCA